MSTWQCKSSNARVAHITTKLQTITSTHHIKEIYKIGRKFHYKNARKMQEKKCLPFIIMDPSPSFNDETTTVVATYHLMWIAY